MNINFALFVKATEKRNRFTKVIVCVTKRIKFHAHIFETIRANRAALWGIRLTRIRIVRFVNMNRAIRQHDMKRDEIQVVN